MSQVECQNLGLRLNGGKLTVSCLSDNSALSLIIAIRFVRKGCQLSTGPIQRPSSPVSIDVASLSQSVGDTFVQITAELCLLLPGAPRGWKVAETASVVADFRAELQDEVKELANSLCHQLSLSMSPSLFLRPPLDTGHEGLFSLFWKVPHVSVKFMSAVQAVVKWKNENDDIPHQWMISLTSTAEEKTSEYATTYFYTLDGRTSKQKLPIQLKPATQYTVTVAPLFKSSSCIKPVPSYWLRDESTVPFTTPPIELTSRDLRTLHHAAVKYCSQSGSAVCKWLYRNKSVEYFHDILNNSHGIMKVYRKDNSGDPASQINGRIDGLFFMAKNINGNPPRYSYFGSCRLQVPVHILQQRAPNLYFADFYCMQGSVHQVTLVMTKCGSKSDEFCREKLLPLSFIDRQDSEDTEDNPFFFRSGEQLFTSNMRKLEVELLYTEDINIFELLLPDNGARLSSTETRGRGHSRPEGIPKNPLCTTCNVHLQ